MLKMQKVSNCQIMKNWTNIFFVERCSLETDFVKADIKGTSETLIGSTDTRVLCAALVRDKYPDAIGATWGRYTTSNFMTGIQRDCYAEFGAPESEFEYSTSYAM